MLKDHKANGEAVAYNGTVPAEIEAMVDSVRNGFGDSDVSLRQVVFRRGMAHLGFPESDTAVPQTLTHFVDTIARHAPDITDQDVQDLLNAGWSEAEIFEVAVAASVAAGYGRLKIAWSTLADAQ